LKKWGLGLVGLSLALLTGVWLTLRASLPQVDGERLVDGLARAVAIERDALGVPTLRAANRADLAYATGFVHAQDRFFQMDLLRRSAAGRLAELLGSGLVDTDRHLRVHGFEHVARQIVAALSVEERTLLEAYAAGVNAAMSMWRARPPEYLLLRTSPSPWSATDSILVAHAMFLDLNDSTGRREIERAQLRASLPAELAGFLDPPGTEWDAPLLGGALEVPPIPGSNVLDLRAASVARADRPTARIEDGFDGVAVGSNNWAVSGRHTRSGAAILANDMHLGLRIPNVWYRVRLIVTGNGGGTDRDLTGVTLPGTPILIAGSNGQVAWGYTNSYGDWTDVVIIEPDPSDPDRYLTPAGPQSYVERQELIATAHTDGTERLVVRSTVWGPIIGELDGRPIALAWTAHRAEAANLRHLALETVRTVEEALAVANSIGAPVQNFVAADAAGNIGWTLMGRVPIRVGYDPALPALWHAPGVGWMGWRRPDEYPRILNPPSGRIWTANARVLDAAGLAFVGNGGYDRGARAGQIRDALLALEDATPADMAAIQLDDRARFLRRWQELLLGVLDSRALTAQPRRTLARDLVRSWQGRASVEDVGYRIVRAFRLATLDRVFAALTAPARSRYPDAQFRPSPQFEGSLWQLVTQRPRHLLDSRHADWRDALLGSLDEVLDELEKVCGEIDRCTWGERNRLAMQHPIARALPLLSAVLDMPAVELPGDADMPRVQAPGFGASERFAVTPGREAEGYYHMPGGQSGHPLSPFYRAGHEAWVRGEPMPFLPGSTLHRLKLVPR